VICPLRKEAGKLHFRLRPASQSCFPSASAAEDTRRWRRWRDGGGRGPVAPRGDDVGHRHAVRCRPPPGWPEISRRCDGMGLAVCVSRVADLPRSALGTAYALSSSRIGRAEGDRDGGASIGHREEGRPAHVSAFLCNSSSRRRLRYSDSAGVAWAQGCQHDDGVHARAQSRGGRGEESCGSAGVVCAEGLAARRRIDGHRG
jgi:hypothetical protein